MDLTDGQVRTAIAAIIKAAQPDAVVFDWNVLGHKEREWPGMFRTTGGTHGWVIKRSRAVSEWKGTGGRTRTLWTYDVFGFYGFRAGKSGDNSDEEFAEIVDAVSEAFRASGTLGLTEVEGHELMQFQLISTIDCGEEMLHFAAGTLIVRPCC